jgi:hypothetical protein
MGVLLAEGLTRRARTYYLALRARGIGHQAALRQLSNRLVGRLTSQNMGCLPLCARRLGLLPWA